jgi:hypothetical protein
MSVKRYAFDVELLTIASAMNLKIRELPIEITLDHNFRIQEIGKMLLDLTAISYRHRIRKWYKKQLFYYFFHLQTTMNKRERDREKNSAYS